MRKKAYLTILLLAIITVIACGCNPRNNDKTENKVTYGDVYVSHAAITPYTRADLLATLPDGVEPYVNGDGYYDDAYIEDANLLICQKTVGTQKLLGVYSFTKGEFLGDGVAYTALSYDFGMLTLAKKTAEGENIFTVMRPDGTFIFAADAGYPKYGETDVTNVFIPVSNNYIAVHAQGKLYNIYTADGTVVNNAEGKPLTVSSEYYGKTTYKVFGLKAYDDYLASTVYTGTVTQTEKTVKFYDLKNGGKVIYDAFATLGDYPSTGTSARRAYYLGNGKLYCYETRTDTADKDSHQFALVDGDKTTYYKASIWTYDLANGIKTVLPPDKLFVEIINEYNSEQTTLNAEYYLQKGFSLANKVYVRAADKTVGADQYIIDSDLNVYVSFYDKSGTASVYNDLNDDARDVVLTFVGEIGFFVDTDGLNPTSLMLFDDEGNTVLKKSGNYFNVFYNNGIVVAANAVYNDEGSMLKTKTYYSAYNIDGTPVFDAESEANKFSEMSAYVGNYALVKDTAGKVYIIDRTGAIVREITAEQLAIKYDSLQKIWISQSASKGGTLLYKSGVYATISTDGKTFGLKTYAGDVLFDNDFSNVVLDKRGTNELVFYAKSEGIWNIYSIK